MSWSREREEYYEYTSSSKRFVRTCVVEYLLIMNGKKKNKKKYVSSRALRTHVVTTRMIDLQSTQEMLGRRICGYDFDCTPSA